MIGAVFHFGGEEPTERCVSLVGSLGVTDVLITKLSYSIFSSLSLHFCLKITISQ